MGWPEYAPTEYQTNREYLEADVNFRRLVAARNSKVFGLRSYHAVEEKLRKWDEIE